MSIRVIGAAIGHGAQDPESQNAPDYLRGRGFARFISQFLEEQGFERFSDVSWDTTLYPHFTRNHAKDLPIVSEFCERLQKVVGRVVNESDFPLIIGGDHSCAVGTWSGIARVLLERGQELPGLLWVDAHLDSHTFETSPSWALHGMPLACLLGKGHRGLVTCGGFSPKIDTTRCAVVGARSWEEGELELLEHLGVRVFTMNEVEQRGLPAVLAEALAIVSAHGFWGMTVDLDAFDPEQCPGVGSPEKNGIKPAEFIDYFKNNLSEGASRLIGLELVEYAPARDKGGKTEQVLKEITATILAYTETNHA